MGTSGNDGKGVNYIGEYDRFITLLSCLRAVGSALPLWVDLGVLMEPQVAGRFDSPQPTWNSLR